MSKISIPSLNVSLIPSRVMIFTFVDTFMDSWIKEKGVLEDMN